jgi:carboxypeptidase family protein
VTRKHTLTVGIPGVVRLASTLFIAFTLGGSAVASQPVATAVAGAVTVPAPDGQPFVVPGVTLTLRCGVGEPRMEVSNERGEFRFADVPDGVCVLTAELQGFKAATTDAAVKSGETTTVAIQLGLEMLHEEVTVHAQADAIEANPIAAHVERMTAQMMRTAPLASERFQDALPLIPGVVRGPDGLLNINGTRSNQSALRFNNADGTDPVTGEDAIELPIDAVSSVQVRGAAFAPEFGLSAGAMTTVETERAGDAWHVVLNDLEPRLRRRAGEFRGIESWTPRVTFGGPIVKGGVSLLESAQYEYSQTRVFGLPAFESDTKLQSFESYTRADWSISARQHFTASAMISPRKTTYAGLNTFNPQAVTPNIRNDNVLGSVSDRLVVGQRGVLDARISVKQFNATIHPSQGHGPMVLAPDVNTGSYFNDQDRASRRTEWLTTYGFSPIGPAHLVKVGAGITYEAFDGTSTSRPVDIVRANGTLLEEIAFVGGGELSRNRWGVQGYAQDSWTVSPRLSVQYGARFDNDSFTGDVNIAPRGSFTATLTNDGRTIIRSGAGAFYDPIPLNVASFVQLQERTNTRFGADGVTPSGPPRLVRNAVAAAIDTPRSLNWNLEVDREWIRNFFVRVGYQQRESRFESVLDPATLATGDEILQLRSDGKSRYREGQMTARYQFHGSDQIVGSYTRSSAVGNLNDFNTYFGNIENPVIRPDARGPLPWDAPNRYLFWSNVSLPRGFTVFPLLDLRTGFPLSTIDEDRNFVGARNEAGRYPAFLSLDMQVSKRLHLFGHDATIGVKVFNITNHFNPREYQGNLVSANYGGFANSVGRTFRGKWVFEF